MTADVINFWNLDHANGTIDNRESKYAIDKEKLFPRQSYILDLGGGRGADAVYFVKKGHKVVLIDISDTALEMARERASRDSVKMETKRLTLGEERLPYSQNAFDVVYSRLALHYFNPEITNAIFKNIYEVLKPNGVAYLTLKSPKDKEEMDFLRSNSHQISDNVFESEGLIKSRYSKEQLKQMLSEANIESYEINEIGENLDRKSGPIRSGNTKFILNEIIFKKI